MFRQYSNKHDTATPNDSSARRKTFEEHYMKAVKNKWHPKDAFEYAIKKNLDDVCAAKNLQMSLATREYITGKMLKHFSDAIYNGETTNFAIDWAKEHGQHLISQWIEANSLSEERFEQYGGGGAGSSLPCPETFHSFEGYIPRFPGAFTRSSSMPHFDSRGYNVRDATPNGGVPHFGHENFIPSSFPYEYFRRFHQTREYRPSSAPPTSPQSSRQSPKHNRNYSRAHGTHHFTSHGNPFPSSFFSESHNASSSSHDNPHSSSSYSSKSYYKNSSSSSHEDRNAPKVCLYTLLGVSRSASSDEIKKAYRKLSLKYHPDRAGEADKQAATDMMAGINQAKDILSDDRKRNFYDSTGCIPGIGDV